MRAVFHKVRRAVQQLKINTIYIDKYLLYLSLLQAESSVWKTTGGWSAETCFILGL